MKLKREGKKRLCGKQRGTAALIFCGILILTGCGKNAEETAAPRLLEPADAPVETAYAERRDVYQISTYESSVIPYLEELAFEKSGSLEKFCVAIGDTVEQGQTLAVLDDSALTDSYNALLEQLETMQENNAYSNRLSEIEIEVCRLSGQDTARLELKYRQAKELQELEEKHLRQKITDAENELGANQIKAPFDGTVAAVAEIGSGSSVSEGSAVLALAREDSCYMTCDYISEKTVQESSRIYAVIHGKEYEIEYQPYDSEELAALSLNGITPVSTFRLAADGQVSIGDYALICMVGNYREQVISVPVDAIYTESGQKYVYVVDGSSRIKTPVETGVYGTMYVEILDGLEEGACVYVRN